MTPSPNDMRVARELLNKQLNLSGILDGRISGAFREWPRIRPELELFLDDIAQALADEREKCAVIAENYKHTFIDHENKQRTIKPLWGEETAKAIRDQK